MLKTISATVQAQCRQTETLGRYGGEEFLRLLPDINLAQGSALTKRLRQAFEGRVSIADQHHLRITAMLEAKKPGATAPASHPESICQEKYRAPRIAWANRSS